MFGFLLALSIFLQTAKPFLAEVPTKYLEPAPPAARTVATVDGVEIKAKDVEDYLWQWRGADAVREMVEYQVVKAEADRRRVTVTAAEIELKLADSLKAFTEQQPGKDVDDALQLQGFTRSRAFLRLTRQALLEKIALQNWKASDFVKVSAITIKPGTGKTLEQALADGKAAYEKLTKGVKWDAVLATTTSDPQVLQDGGLLGWRSLHIFPDSTVAEMTPMKAGQVTKPVQTTAGVQIFRIEAKGNQVPSEQVDELRAQFLAGRLPALEKELRDKAKIVSYTPAKKH